MAQAEDDSFFSRWSQRKRAVREGQPLPEPTPPANIPTAAAAHLQQSQTALQDSNSTSENKVDQSVASPEPPPAPTMKDVHALTPESDFKPFMRADVAPEVKNAAMRELFKDPHFNIRDMMDVYVDDYSKPDPLPPSMLRQLAVTQFLGFWKDEEEAAAKKAREDAGVEAPQNVAHSEPQNSSPSEPATNDIQEAAIAATATQDDHTDLQLQPDDAVGREDAVQRVG